MFTDDSFHNISVGESARGSPPGREPGHFAVLPYGLKDKSQIGAFKTPTLREVEFTSPYMHDGSLKTLEDVVEHYDNGGIKNPQLNQRIKPLHLTAGEKRDLVAFLRALSGEGWQHIKPPTRFPE